MFNKNKNKNNNNIFSFLIYNLTHHRIFTSKILTDDSKLLQESNLTVKKPHRAPHHVIQEITSEGLAQDPYMVARGGVKPDRDEIWLISLVG